MSRVTIKDVAKSAGVSIGTVSKVLNGNQPVKERNRQAIERAIEELNYNVNKVARSMAHKPIKIGIMLPSVFETYFEPMLEGIRQKVASLADYKVNAIYRNYTKFDDDKKVMECLNEFVKEEVNGIILGPYHTVGYSEEFLRLQRRGIPIVSILSEMAKGDCQICVSVDSVLSGKTAAELAKLMLTPGGMAAAFVGNKDVLEHRGKVDSFSQRMKELGCLVSGIYETQDETELAYQLTVNLIRQNPRLQLIYVATGNSEGVCRGITDCGKQKEIHVIVTDVLDELRPFVENGTVVAALEQHLKEQGMLAVDVLYRYLAEGKLESREIHVAPSLLLRSGILDRLQ